MEVLENTFNKLFNCLVKVSRPAKEGIVEMERVELLWKERDSFGTKEMNERIFALADFLDFNVIEVEENKENEGIEIDFGSDDVIFD